MTNKNPKKSSKFYTRWRVFLVSLRKILLRRKGVAKIFVYGTLRKNARNYHQIEKYILSSKKGKVKGKLYVRKDRYVFLTKENGSVTGEFLRVKGGKSALKLFDLFEGREYKRELVYIKTKNSMEEANVYYYAGEVPFDSIFVKSGDYVKYNHSIK